MPENKNQHFVPKCYLKPFSLDQAGAAISLFNIPRGAFFHNASVKSQCSGDYFYGKDPLLERAIQAVENGYAAVLSRVHNRGYVLNESDKSILRTFWLLQYTRTEAASRRSAEMANGMVDHAYAPEEYRMSIKEAVQIAMRVFPDLLNEISDIRLCLVRNRTDVPFIASDDPAIMTNRWHLSDNIALGRSMGIGSAGALFFLPLSPKVLCVLYDSDVYSFAHQSGWVDVRRPEDIHAFNEHQFLSCLANIYFSDWPGREQIPREVARVAGSRIAVRHRFHVAILDDERDGYQRYKVVDPEEVQDGHRMVVHSELLSPTPSFWPSVIGWRNRGSIYSNGTGLGFVRRARAETYGISSFRRIRLH